MKVSLLIPCLLLLLSCQQQPSLPEQESKKTNPTETSSTALVLLGTLQDAGSPHIGCDRSCCAKLFDTPDPNRQVIALGLQDGANEKKYLFEASPDISRQLKTLKQFGQPSDSEMPDGIFLTHAHIGHYSGLMYLGKEARDAKEVPVYAMPRMRKFLTNNGPWSQLVSRRNIVLASLEHETPVVLNPDPRSKLTVTPFLVPHRDEYSETVGYRIQGPNKSALFIPDIDKWEFWEQDINRVLETVDYAFLDATFYSGKELNNRDMAEIPHPFILESVARLDTLSLPTGRQARKAKQKIIFIHFNHTNPVLDPESPEAKHVRELGFQLGRIGQVFEL
ncbi:MBL fold metallo-hydrolase [Croceiramulus getboli]|nr:MBL fold metallo-hydrolase [Flavobacteriaceae bacterium YJPT1-3]